MLPDRKFVKVIKGAITFTVPEEELSYYTRAGFLREGEEPNLANMTPAEIRMAQIDAGEVPDNQVSSVNLANVDVPATSEEVAVAVHLGPAGSGVAGPAASAKAKADAEEIESEHVESEPIFVEDAPKFAAKKKAGK